MSGALIELAAKGVQDAYLTGKPEVSFFHQAYKRHTNFAQKPVTINPIGSAAASQMVTLKIDNKGDLLGYIWIDMTGTNRTVADLQDTIFELYIGGQLIDRQDGFYMSQLWQKFLVDSSAKGYALNASNNNGSYGIQVSKWLPLHFFFCDSCYLPLVALQYHEVEIRITYGITGVWSAQPNYYANYVVLDTDEREAIVNRDIELLIEQVQKITAESSTNTGNNKFDLSYLNHPVKCLLWGDVTTTDNFKSNVVQLYLNGTEVFNNPMPDIFFAQVQGYYHSEFASTLLAGYNDSLSGRNLKMYSFALKANKHQPCGSCNFSRLDNASMTFAQAGNSNTTLYLYAVNFNVLRIQKGLSGLMFSN